MKFLYQTGKYQNESWLSSDKILHNTIEWNGIGVHHGKYPERDDKPTKNPSDYCQSEQSHKSDAKPDSIAIRLSESISSEV
jgi:hypothetical protein